METTSPDLCFLMNRRKLCSLETSAFAFGKMMDGIDFISLFGLNKQPKINLQGEDQIVASFVNLLKKKSIEGDFHGIFFKVTNENHDNKNFVYGMKLKMTGKINGAPDIVVLKGGLDSGGFPCLKGVTLEFKAPKGRVSPSQRLFLGWCAYANVPYHVVYSVQEAMDILAKYDLLS